jgi:hypothetical protein
MRDEESLAATEFDFFWRRWQAVGFTHQRQKPVRSFKPDPTCDVPLTFRTSQVGNYAPAPRNSTFTGAQGVGCSRVSRVVG